MHTIENPLELTWKNNEYRVNKRNEYTQKLVSLEYALRMEEALKNAKLQIEYLHNKFKETGSGNQVLSEINRALTQK